MGENDSMWILRSGRYGNNVIICNIIIRHNSLVLHINVHHRVLYFNCGLKTRIIIYMYAVHLIRSSHHYIVSMCTKWIPNNASSWLVGFSLINVGFNFKRSLVVMNISGLLASIILTYPDEAFSKLRN